MYNLYVQVAGGDGSVERAVDVSPNEMSRAGGLRLVNPQDRGKWACLLMVVRRQLRRECHQCLRSRQAEQDEHCVAGHAAYRSWCEHCVKGRGRVSPHAVVSERELPEVGVDYAYLGPPGSQVTIFGVQVQTHVATQVPEKGMNVYAPAFFTGWLRGLGRKRLLLRSDKKRALLAFLRAAAASLEGVEVIEQASRSEWTR